jgi:hypothetical protein
MVGQKPQYALNEVIGILDCEFVPIPVRGLVSNIRKVGDSLLYEHVVLSSFRELGIHSIKLWFRWQSDGWVFPAELAEMVFKDRAYNDGGSLPIALIKEVPRLVDEVSEHLCTYEPAKILEVPTVEIGQQRLQNAKLVSKIMD